MEMNSPAIVLSREEDVMAHGYVFYGLVKPAGKKHEGVASAAAMVNVIPRRRIYRMEEVEELEKFEDEILKRPLVLQPIVQSGKGIRSLNCFFSVQNENWVAMINQAHPKIRARIKMGVEAAKTVMKRGEPYILEFLFSDIIRRLYLGSSASYELNINRKFSDCEHGDLIIRYGGDACHQGVSWEMKTRHMQFSFDDLDGYDIMVRTMSTAVQERQSPIIQVIPERELLQILPGWSFNQAEEDYEDEEEEYQEEPFYEAAQQDRAAIYPEGASANPGRIKGRAQRKKAEASKHEVSVELHVPFDDSAMRNDRNYHQFDERLEYDQRNDDEHSYRSDERRDYSYGHDDARQHKQNQRLHNNNYTNLKTDRSDHEYQTVMAPSGADLNRYNHYHQGSGRSGSSAADSGFDENDGGFESGKYAHLKNANKNRFHDSNYSAPSDDKYQQMGPDRYNRQNYQPVGPDRYNLNEKQNLASPPHSDRYTANQQAYKKSYGADRYNTDIQSHPPSDRYNTDIQSRPPSDRYNNGRHYIPPTSNKNDKYNYDNTGFVHENYDVVEESISKNKSMAAKMLQQNNRSAPGDRMMRDMSSRQPTNNYQHMPSISKNVQDQFVDESVI